MQIRKIYCRIQFRISRHNKNKVNIRTFNLHHYLNKSSHHHMMSLNLIQTKRKRKLKRLKANKKINPILKIKQKTNKKLFLKSPFLPKNRKIKRPTLLLINMQQINNQKIHNAHLTSS